ncbi:MAG: energy transducer TonB [Ignavibacteriales bacterium]|nr:energy transducer TonB [Ignavibacteriales bacterium]
MVHKTNTAEFIPPSQVEILKPTLLSKIDLVYPQEAINKRIEGETLAKLFITKEGKVSEVLVEKSSGHQILDTATINYVNKLKFLPAEYKGKYKSVWITMLVKFSFE